MSFRFDTIVPQLIAQKKVKAKQMRRPFRLRKPPRPADIKGLQRGYLSVIMPIIRAMQEAIEENLIPVLGAITTQAANQAPQGATKATADSLKADTFIDDIDRAMEFARLAYVRKFSPDVIAAIVKKYADRIEIFNGVQIDKTFGAVLGIDIARVEPWLPTQIAAFTRENVSLIKSIPDQFFDRVEQTVIRNVQAGKLTREITAEIQQAYGVSESRAALIARDQTAKFNGNLNRLRQTNVGVTKYQWATSGDERVRPEHEANEGKIFSWDDPPATGHPGEDINCRCSAIPVFDQPTEAEE